jgi:hypothetical protein
VRGELVVGKEDGGLEVTCDYGGFGRGGHVFLRYMYNRNLLVIRVRCP